MGGGDESQSTLPISRRGTVVCPGWGTGETSEGYDLPERKSQSRVLRGHLPIRPEDNMFRRTPFGRAGVREKGPQ